MERQPGGLSVPKTETFSRRYRTALLGLAALAAVVAGNSADKSAAAAGFLVDCAKVTDSNGKLIYPRAFNAKPGKYSTAIGSDPPTDVGFNEDGVFVVEKLYGRPSVVLHDPNFERKVGKPASWLAMVEMPVSGNAAGGEALWASGDPSLRTAICK